MNIYAKKGTKIVGLFKDNIIVGGYKTEQEYASKYIKEGEVYTVNHTEVFSWHTDVFLEEFPDNCFNSVHFVDVDSEDGKKEIAKKRLSY